MIDKLLHILLLLPILSLYTCLPWSASYPITLSLCQRGAASTPSTFLTKLVLKSYNFQRGYGISNYTQVWQTILY